MIDIPLFEMWEANEKGEIRIRIGNEIWTEGNSRTHTSRQERNIQKFCFVGRGIEFGNTGSYFLSVDKLFELLDTVDLGRILEVNSLV